MPEHLLDGNSPFKCGERRLDQTIQDFWAWSMSRLLADGPRGDLAEFIVNIALGVSVTVPKRGWGECDIIYRGKRIEVKCSSVIQEWERQTPSRPVFSIAKTLSCDCVERDGRFVYVGRPLGDTPKRRSEVYVFCLFSENDRTKADPTDLDQWRFYVLPTAVINEKLGGQRQVSVKTIERLGAARCDFAHIKENVDRSLELL